MLNIINWNKVNLFYLPRDSSNTIQDICGGSFGGNNNNILKILDLNQRLNSFYKMVFVQCLKISREHSNFYDQKILLSLCPQSLVI